MRTGTTKHLLLALVTTFWATSVNAADVSTSPIVNIKYIHEYIMQKWGIDVPYNPDLADKTRAANMKYLLTAVDVANEILNNVKTTDYGNGKYATQQAVNTNTAIRAIDTLILDQNGEFWYVVAGTTTTATIDIQQGTFTIYWGDGEHTLVTHTPTDSHQAHRHTYTDGRAQHTVRIPGRATRYADMSSNPAAPAAAIQFWSATNKILAVGGCLGCIFPTIENGDEPWQQPTFYKAFSGQSSLTGAVPYGLFNGIHGKPSYGMFWATFENSGISELPDQLFANISGSAAGVANTFRDTFKECGNLTSIPTNLFGSITDVDNREFFWGMFYNDRNITGPAPKIDGKNLWELWPNLQTQMFTNCNLDLQSQMPPNYRN